MIRIANNIAIVVISIFSLSACAKAHNTDMANQAKVDLVGMSKLALYECAGVPLKKENVEGVEFISYVSKKLKSGDGTIKQDLCEATFTVKDGRVSKLTYISNEGLLDRKFGFISRECYRIVKGCL